MNRSITKLMIALAMATTSLFAQSAKWELSNIRPLTDGTISVHYYAWSPDGQKIAIVSDELSLCYLNKIHGGLLVPVATNLGATSVQWSPDSKKIVYIKKIETIDDNPQHQYKRESNWFAYVSDISNNTSEKLFSSTKGLNNPKWLSNGAIQLFDRSDNNDAIFVDKWKTGKTIKASEKFSYTIDRDKNIYLIIDGGKKKITTSGDYYGYYISHNGNHLATWWAKEHSISLIKLTPPFEEKVLSIDIGPNDWSADDHFILGTKYTNDEMNGDKCDICIIDSEGKEVTFLTNTPNVIELRPTFSPDGSMIAYIAKGLDGVNNLFIADLRRK